MNNKTFWTIFAIAAIMRIAGIWIPQFWYDENFTLILSRLPFDRMISATAGDVHPPLWYLITWTVSHIAPLAPPWVLRLPSLVFSLASLVLLRKVMREWILPAKIQLGAMLIMALVPMQLWYAQEARMYALLEMLVLLAVLYTLRGNWIGLFVASLALLYTQNYGVFYLASIGLLVLVRDWRSVPHAALAIGSAGALYLPWVRVLASQMDAISGRYWIQSQTIGDALNILYKMFFASSMPGFALLSGMIVTFIALAAGLVTMATTHHPAKWTIIIMAFVPLALGWIVSLAWQPVLLHRPLIGIAPFLYIVAAWSMARVLEADPLHVQREAVIAAALVIPILVSGTGGYYHNIPAMKSDGAVSPLIDTLDYVRAHWQAGDVIIYADDGPMINLSPYAADLPQYQIPACGDRVNSGPVLGSLTNATRDAIGIQRVTIEEIHGRAWVYAPFSPLHPQCYEDYIAPITPGDPLLTVDDNQYIFSGVWLLGADQ